MPNDAKLGLLVGAVGVLMAAVMIGPKAPAVSPQAESDSKPRTARVESVAPQPLARASVPGSPSKPELQGTPVKRIANRDR